MTRLTPKEIAKVPARLRRNQSRKRYSTKEIAKSPKFKISVIPAKAGIQVYEKGKNLDSRLRGKDDQRRVDSLSA
jgi:hypothetical protein